MSAIPPSCADIAPRMYPPIKNQGSYDTCVAEAVTTALELLHSQAMGITSVYENYSIRYLFGSDNRPDYIGMYFEEALSIAQYSGVPRWELFDTFYPKRASKSEAVSAHGSACSLAIQNGYKQTISSYYAIDFYDGDEIAAVLRSNGYVMLGINIPRNFYYLGRNGVVQPPSGGWSGAGHFMVIIGLTTINGKRYWITVNSWGEGWGDSGICYFPYDWAYGFDPPENGSGSDTLNPEEGGDPDPDPGPTPDPGGWVSGCYAVYDNSVDTNHLAIPVITDAQFTDDNHKAEISFTMDSGCSVLIYAQKENGDGQWWPKGENGATSFGNACSASPVTITLDSTMDSYLVSLIAVNSRNVLSLRSTTFRIGGNGSVYIYHNGEWRPVIPYIYNGTEWVRATPMIYQNGWQ